MSTEDATSLAGVIDTWAAVLIGLVALLGVLPVYFLYKKLRTTKARALVIVDDPTRTFVARGIRLAGLRLKQKHEVPDLRYPPRLDAIVNPPPLGLAKLGSEASTTCWVNFARVTLAICPTVETHL